MVKFNMLFLVFSSEVMAICSYGSLALVGLQC